LLTGFGTVDSASVEENCTQNAKQQASQADRRVMVCLVKADKDPETQKKTPKKTDQMKPLWEKYKGKFTNNQWRHAIPQV